MSKVKTYLHHELASYLPLLEGEEFDALVEDIREYGQIESAILYEGKILDGRNRHRACQVLGIELHVKEWKPSKATGNTPLQFVISENIMRRHLNDAQKAEIAMLLYPEVEEEVKEEKGKKQSETLKDIGVAQGGKKGFQEINVINKKKINTLKDYKIEDTTAYKVAKKVKVKPHVINKTKKIKEAIDGNEEKEPDKEIKKRWEDAKKGKQGASISRVYKEVIKKEIIEEQPKNIQNALKAKIKSNPEFNKYEKIKEVIKLPKDLQKEVLKPEAKITIEEAKEIAEFPEPEQRKAIIKQVEQTKQAGKKLIQEKKDIIENKRPAPIKIINLDTKFINAWKNTKVIDIPIRFKKQFLESYSEETKQECLKLVKSVVNYLIKEFSDEVKVIDTR